MALLLETSRQVVILELTVTWEDQMEEVTERKRGKYADLVGECCRQGRRTWRLSIEEGCGGFAGRTLCRAYHLLHITGVHKRQH